MSLGDKCERWILSCSWAGNFWRWTFIYPQSSTIFICAEKNWKTNRQAVQIRLQEKKKKIKEKRKKKEEKEKKKTKEKEKITKKKKIKLKKHIF